MRNTVDTAEVPSTSRSSSAGAAVRTKVKGVSASQARAQSTGKHQCADPKTKQRTKQLHQGIRAMVANVLERQGIE